MKTTLLAFITIFSQSLQAADLVCTSSDGLFSYKTNSRSGGAAPYPGMKIGQVSWFYQGSIIFQKEIFNQAPETQIESNLEWKENWESKIVLEQERENHYSHKQTYAIRISLFANNESETISGTELKSYQDWFICKQETIFYP